MAFDPELDKISINELNKDLQRKINVNYEETEGLREDLETHLESVPNPEASDYKTSTAMHVIFQERTYWNNVENIAKTYTNEKIGPIKYENVALGLDDKANLGEFNLLVGDDWRSRSSHTLSEVAFSGRYQDVIGAPEVDSEGMVKYALNAKTANVATSALNADNASMAAMANYTTTAEKAYNAFMLNNAMLVVHDTVPTTAYIQEILANTELVASTVLWVDTTNNKFKFCLNFMSYTDDNRPWITIGS